MTEPERTPQTPPDLEERWIKLWNDYDNVRSDPTTPSGVWLENVREYRAAVIELAQQGVSAERDAARAEVERCRSALAEVVQMLEPSENGPPEVNLALIAARAALSTEAAQ